MIKTKQIEQITNNQMGIWVCALLSGKNGDINMDHPPKTKGFKWKKQQDNCSNNQGLLNKNLNSTKSNINNN
ncbi:hypothetical protein VP01_223g2 [Puccinia sorghi]|uniref:Uncharacterized protein n=1 Tax=Puccinia sorghi TaxID=27349 RepID=A0A0L6V8R4_9BASI|nr:hypothetical protein VP01_223g2 [Puccinia sorghi]